MCITPNADDCEIPLSFFYNYKKALSRESILNFITFLYNAVFMLFIIFPLDKSYEKLALFVGGSDNSRGNTSRECRP